MAIAILEALNGGHAIEKDFKTLATSQWCERYGVPPSFVSGSPLTPVMRPLSSEGTSLSGGLVLQGEHPEPDYLWAGGSGEQFDGVALRVELDEAQA